jgi:serine/threonine-protein kinase PknK
VCSGARGVRRGCAAAAAALFWLAAIAAAAAAATAQLPVPVYRTTAVVAAGRIYLLGGHNSAGGTISDVYAINPETGRSYHAGTLALPTHGAAAAVLHGRILVFGGASSAVHDVVQLFSPATRRTRVIGHMPTVRADVTAVVVGRRAILVGGFNGAGPQQDVWATSDGRHFHTIAHLRQPVRYPAVAALGDAVYVFGGLISGGEYSGSFSNAIQRIDLATGTTRIVAHLPTPLAHAMAATVGRHLYLLGGSTPAGPTNRILRFEPAQGRTVAAGRLPAPRTDAAVASIGRTVYLLGGISSRPLSGITAVHPGR